MKDASKFSMKFASSVLICLARLLFGRKRSKMILNSVRCDLSQIRFGAGRSIAHALESGFVAPINLLILAILKCIRDAEIGTAIIQCVAINVISLPLVTVLEAQQLAMHLNTSRVLVVVPFSIKTVHVWAPLSLPLPLRKPLIIGSINDSDLTLSKKDRAIRCFRGHARSNQRVGVIRRSQRLTPILYRHFCEKGMSI